MTPSHYSNTGMLFFDHGRYFLNIAILGFDGSKSYNSRLEVQDFLHNDRIIDQDRIYHPLYSDQDEAVGPHRSGVTLVTLIICTAQTQNEFYFIKCALPTLDIIVGTTRGEQRKQ